MLRKSEEYHTLARQVSIPSFDSLETFLRNRRLIAEGLSALEQQDSVLPPSPPRRTGFATHTNSKGNYIFAQRA